MTDDDRAVDPEDVEQSDEAIGNRDVRVLLGLPGPAGSAVAGHVGGDGTVSGCRFLRVLSAAYRADLQPSKSLSSNDSRYLAGILRTYRAMSRYTRVRDCENLETRTPAATNPKAVHKERWGALALPHRITL